MLFSHLLKMKTWFSLVIQNNSILKLSWNDLQTSFIPEKLRRSRRISCIPVSSTEQIASWICIGGVWTWQQKYHNHASFHQVQAFHSSPGWQRLKEGAISGQWDSEGSVYETQSWFKQNRTFCWLLYDWGVCNDANCFTSCLIGVTQSAIQPHYPLCSNNRAEQVKERGGSLHHCPALFCSL